MSDQIITNVLQYGITIMEAMLCLLLASQGRWRRHKGLFVYVALLFGLDGVARAVVLDYYGRTSVQYAYFYWLSDVVLAMGAFLLTCAFFRRASSREDKIWGIARLMLVFVFVVVLGISALSLTRNYSHLWSPFIIEFSQNLYFSCLVLNTLLYIMLQQVAIDNDELGLLVCGMGVQFAGEAACLALYHLTWGEHFASLLFSLLNPACTLGMLLIWMYAITKVPQVESVRSLKGKQVAWVHAVSD
jgi:hypothetical protein